MRKLAILLSVFCCLSASAASFEELRNKVGNREGIVVPQGTVIEGIIISDFSSANMETAPQVSASEVDPSLNYRTAYIQSMDGAYGFRIVFNSIYDNRFPRFSKVKVDLGGAELIKETDPDRYTICNIVGGMVDILEERVAPAPKVRHIGELTDQDIYTFVTLADVELMSKEGSYTKVHERKVASTWINSFKTPKNGPADASGVILKDNQGDDIFMAVNTRCPWRRRGEMLPQGVGTVDGVLVHTVIRRYGDIGRYAIRPADEKDIKIAKDGPSSYQTIVEWNWDRNYDVALNFERQGRKEWIFGEAFEPDRVLPDIGKGFLYTTAGAKMRLDNEWNTRCVHDGNDPGAGAREWSILRLQGNTKDWYIYNEDKIVGANAIVVETSTVGFEGQAVSFDFSFSAGNCSTHLSWGFPGEWQVAYSVDGKTFIPVQRTFLLRPIWYNPGNVKELGGRRELCYDAAIGGIECTVTLPAFLLGKEQVWFRIFPSSTKLTVLPENPADDINSGTMQAGFAHDFALRLGKVSVKALK